MLIPGCSEYCSEPAERNPFVVWGVVFIYIPHQLFILLNHDHDNDRFSALWGTVPYPLDHRRDPAEPFWSRILELH